MNSTSTLPDGFSVIKVGRTELIIKDLYRDRLMGRKIHNPEALFRQHKDKARFMEGRGFLLSLPVDEKGSERMVIRHYEHGGILRTLTSDLFLGGSRPFHELFITEMARKAGLPTIEVLVAVKRWVFWPFYKGDLISKEIPNATDLIHYLARLRKDRSREQLSKKRELIRQAGRLVRKMHEVGIYHSDLHLKNLIVEVKEGTLRSLHVIDFDRAAITHPLESDKWFCNLLRLDRSAQKWAAKGLWITRTDRLRFLKSYLGGEEERKASVRKFLKGHPLRRMRYRLGWAIERLLYG